MARILVVDDNAVNLDLMLYLLRHFGHEVQGENDGLSGFSAAVTGEFDVVLSDVLMPGIDGYELVRRLKDNPRTSNLPLLAVTALAMPGDKERILGGGFDGYITKPINPQTFVAQVEAFTSGAR